MLKLHVFSHLQSYACRKCQVSKITKCKVDTSAYLSSSTAAVNADEPPVHGDLVNSKSVESAIRNDSKKIDTKGKSNTEMKVNSNTNNNVETKKRQERKNKAPRERYEENGKKGTVRNGRTVRKIKIKIRKS